MRALYIENNKVINVAVVNKLPEGYVEDKWKAGPGWDFKDGVATPPVVPVRSESELLKEAQTRITVLFEQAMDKLANGYSQAEINTFAQKLNTARVYKSGKATPLQRIYLAKLAGLELPYVASDQEAADLHNTIKDGGGSVSASTFDSAVKASADKIVEKSIQLTMKSAEVERLRNKALVDVQEDIDGALTVLIEAYENI